jgi:hypothetical protein
MAAKTKLSEVSLTRFPHEGGKGGGRSLAYNHPAILEGRSLFPSRVTDPIDTEPLLKSGHNNAKIGARIQKGELAGFPIFTLTLEERATCPRSCALYRSCYGNGMQWPKRWRAGPLLEARLAEEIRVLSHQYPRGYLVRLHILGDFYSAEYVALWRKWLREFPALHVFGFTAHIDPLQPITKQIAEGIKEFGSRFSIRFSNADLSKRATETVELPDHASSTSIVCPQQLGKTLCCATCALCWHTDKNIAFLRH